MGGPVCAPDPSGEPGVLSGAGTEAREAAGLPLGVWLAAAACLLPELGKRAFAAQLGILSVLLGGISNQWDRLRRGSVTDYLQFPHRKAKKRALVWNLADFMLIGGVVLTVAGLGKELIKK